MNVLLIPFFLAARVAVDAPWEYGPAYDFQVLVNSVAVLEEEPDESMRLIVSSRLTCQPKRRHTLSCHFHDSKANSFTSRNVDPRGPAIPIRRTVMPQLAYEINEDQFELEFSEQGLESLLVSEDIQPRELDMIRAIVDPLNIGAIVGDKAEGRFELMENFAQGECVTNFTVDRQLLDRTFYGKYGYVLECGPGLRELQIVRIRKTRNLYMCTHNVSYFFGSCLEQVSGLWSAVTSSESSVLVTPTDFVSSTSNVVRMNEALNAVTTTLYENVTLGLRRIYPAKGEPPEVREAERASIFIGRRLDEDSLEDDV